MEGSWSDIARDLIIKYNPKDDDEIFNTIKEYANEKINSMNNMINDRWSKINGILVGLTISNIVAVLLAIFIKNFKFSIAIGICVLVILFIGIAMYWSNNKYIDLLRNAYFRALSFILYSLIETVYDKKYNDLNGIEEDHGKLLYNFYEYFSKELRK